MTDTKHELQARIDEIRDTVRSIENKLKLGLSSDTILSETLSLMRIRMHQLESSIPDAAEDIIKSVLRSHKAVCMAKNMDEKSAYGQDPAMYYTLAICGEAGEMGNKIVKALRNGDDPEASKRAVRSELPDVFIYGAVLAHVLDIDLTRDVNDKVDVVIQRAIDGYYGGPLPVKP